MLTISLEGIKLFARHGIYPEEKVLENIFLVDISVSIEETEPITHLSQTIDYEKIYEIIQEEMNKPSAMLETTAFACMDHIKQDFLNAKVIDITISKMHPPLGGEVERSKVNLRKEF